MVSRWVGLLIWLSGVSAWGRCRLRHLIWLNLFVMTCDCVVLSIVVGVWFRCSVLVVLITVWRSVGVVV